MNTSHQNDSSHFRSGRYITQPKGYRAFVPASLLTDPQIQVSGSLQASLSKADRSLGRLDGSIQTLPDADMFVYMYVRKEAVLSSQIEGTQSSLQDLLSAEAHALHPDAPKDVDEVVNYVSAMNHGLERLNDLPISVRLIKEIHEKLLEGVRGSHLTPGELRRSQNWIGHGGCSLNDATFVPPPPEIVPELLGDLEKFIHEESDLPLLIKIGLIHAQFETIHPFLDGNGRIGRLLITLLLCEREVLIKPVLYLSYYFKKNRQKYYERLQSVRDNGDWENWLLFFLKGISEVSEQSTRTVREILVLRENHRELMTSKLGRVAGNGHKVLDTLFRRPIVSVNAIRDLIQTTYPAANNLVDKMVDAGILELFTKQQQRNRLFIYRAYLDLFN